MKRILAIAVLLAASDALAVPADAEFLPVKVGTRWSYTGSDGHGVTEAVRGVVDVGDADGKVVGQAGVVDAADGGEFYVLRTETGILRFYDPPSKVGEGSHATWILRFPLHLGKKWESWTPAGTVEFRVSQREPIAGPDGQLTDAVRVDFSSLPEPIFTGHILYARGVGPLEVVEGDYVRKLTGYKVGDGVRVPVAPPIAGLEPPDIKETWRVGKKGWFAIGLTLVMAAGVAALPRLKRKATFKPWEENERELLETDGDLATQAARLESSVAERPGYADLRCKLGTVYLVMERYEDAVAQFGAALEKNPTYVEAALGLARACIKLSRAAEGLAAIRPVADKHPTYADVQNVLGECLAAAGDVPGALAAFKRALEINPKFAGARVNLDRWTAGDGRAST